MTDNFRWVMVLLLSSLSCYIWAAVSAFFSTRPDSLSALRERMTARMNTRITRLPPQFRGWLDERRKTPDAVWFNVTTLRLAAIVLAILATGRAGCRRLDQGSPLITVRCLPKEQTMTDRLDGTGPPK